MSLLLATTLGAQQPPRDSLIPLPGLSVSVARSPMRALDVPLAVTVVNKAQFEHHNGFRLDEALRLIPGVLAQSRFGTSDVRIVIRGFGARGAGDRSNAGTTRGIRILQNGIPETEPDGRTAFDLVDLGAIQGIEVVRSNSSAVWGNAAGGLVNFLSLPGFARPFVAFQEDVGAFGLTREIAQAGAQLGSSKLAATLIRTDFDGYRANSSSERSLVNLGLTAPLGNNTNLNLSVLAADNLFHIPGPLTQAQFDQDPQQANATYLTRRERRRNRIGRFGVSIDHELGAGKTMSGMLFVNPKYLQRSERGTFRDFTRYHTGGNIVFRDQRAFTENVRSAFTMGTDEAYQDGAILFYSLSAQGERGPTLMTDKREGANNFGFFAQEQLSIGDGLDLTIGGRYDNITYYNNDFLNSKLDDRKSFSRLSPKIGVLYRTSANHSIYANVGGGIEAPAGNETDPAPPFDTVTAINPLLDPIRSTTFELGTKQFINMEGFIRGLSYDVALYATNVRNEIVPYRGGRFYFTAAKAQRRGAEVGVQVQTASGFSLETALTFSDNKYKEYVVDSVHYNRPGQTADFSDNKIVGIPDMFGGANLNYVPTFFDAIKLGFEVQAVGDYFADDANRVTVPSYTLYNASLGLAKPVRLGRLDVRGAVRLENLADKTYVASAFLNPDLVGGSPAVYEPGLPRQVFFTLSLGFGR
jgi:iron complex outermembrane receptor protein